MKLHETDLRGGQNGDGEEEWKVEEIEKQEGFEYLR